MPAYDDHDKVILVCAVFDSYSALTKLKEVPNGCRWILLSSNVSVKGDSAIWEYILDGLNSVFASILFRYHTCLTLCLVLTYSYV